MPTYIHSHIYILLIYVYTLIYIHYTHPIHYIDHSEEENHILQLKINELETNNTQIDLKLKNQIELYNTIKQEKNQIFKNLSEITILYTNTQKDNKTYIDLINQLKNDLNIKDIEINKYIFEVSKIEKIRDTLQHEISKVRIMTTCVVYVHVYVYDVYCMRE